VSLRDWIQALLTGRSSGTVPSVRILRHRREIVDLEYRDASHRLRFIGELTGPAWKQINIRISDEKWDQQLLDNLGAGLRQRGYEFLIYRLGNEQNISYNERSWALRELESMGYEAEVSADRRTAWQTRKAGVHPPSKEEAQEMAPRLMKLLESVREVRQPIEILRKSDSALV